MGVKHGHIAMSLRASCRKTALFNKWCQDHSDELWVPVASPYGNRLQMDFSSYQNYRTALIFEVVFFFFFLLFKFWDIDTSCISKTRGQKVKELPIYREGSYGIFPRFSSQKRGAIPSISSSWFFSTDGEYETRNTNTVLRKERHSWMILWKRDVMQTSYLSSSLGERNKFLSYLSFNPI